ncbi:type VI secretion system effector, Hcp1 family protein [Yersinia pestis PY-32]|nr:type VI secretion system effector, Hcp1 family protein [Yersinia pestis PY-06]EIR15701.1 type VI secretion system effector, Hcp1 family protein [Yersinia pestis PY-08]EIR74861.1 type VI secretion system effector, Hcp1 family protein [Yersinia pestis PY-32]EIS54641.1 type VI secretion system effector, Hcp1 family protein [Yersinia pestis PY-63]EIS88699.1 type VI secretion system effector, Hcp1 family protein [Yersinia pestis PY-88]
MIYLTLKGKKQGLISSGCSSIDSIGNKSQGSHIDQIFVLSLNHAMTREQNVSHHPISFIKPIDKSSPLLGVAISENELLDAVFDFYRTNSAGALELYYTISITGATISDISTSHSHSITHNGSQPQETISLKYKSITWNHNVAGTSGYSIWDDRVY